MMLLVELKFCCKSKLNCINQILISHFQFILESFPDFKFVFTPIKVENVIDLNEQLRIVEKIHNRAHRNAINNCFEAQKNYFWPEMKKDYIKWVQRCEICKTENYERVPVKQPIGSTPIPKNVGESISMDLFYIDNKLYVTSVDRYSKYLLVHAIESKVNFHEKLEEILTQNYPACQTLVTDKEAVFVSNSSRVVYRKYKIMHIMTPIQHSTSNGEVERTHSTLIELIRCLSTQNNSNSTEEIFNAVKAYNETIHSVINERPIDVKQNPNGYPDIPNKILIHKYLMLQTRNKHRKNRSFQINEIIYVKSNRRRKYASAYTKHVVKEDFGDSVLTTKNKIYHKDSIRVIKK